MCTLLFTCGYLILSFPGVSVLKNSPANAGDMGSILGSGRSGKGMATHPSILVWEISWTEKTGGLQPLGCRVRHNLTTKQQTT